MRFLKCVLSFETNFGAQYCDEKCKVGFLDGPSSNKTSESADLLVAEWPHWAKLLMSACLNA